MCYATSLPLSSFSLYFIPVSPPPFPFLSGSEHANLLYIAMAGPHQVWAHFLEDAKWLKGWCECTTENVWGMCKAKVSSYEYCHKASHTILLQQCMPSPEHVWQNMDGWTNSSQSCDITMCSTFVWSCSQNCCSKIWQGM